MNQFSSTAHPSRCVRRFRRTYAGAALLLVAGAGCCAAVLSITTGAEALQFRRVPLDPPEVLISARGPIIAGDFDRLVNFLKGLPSADRVLGLSLDSEGGSVFEAEKMAALIKRLDMAILISAGNQCSSACFLLFAAGSHQFVFPGRPDRGAQRQREWQGNCGHHGAHHGNGERCCGYGSAASNNRKARADTAGSRGLVDARRSRIDGRHGDRTEDRRSVTKGGSDGAHVSIFRISDRRRLRRRGPRHRPPTKRALGPASLRGVVRGVERGLQRWRRVLVRATQHAASGALLRPRRAKPCRLDGGLHGCEANPWRVGCSSKVGARLPCRLEQLLTFARSGAGRAAQTQIGREQYSGKLVSPSLLPSPLGGRYPLVTERRPPSAGDMNQRPLPERAPGARSLSGGEVAGPAAGPDDGP